MVRVAFGGCLDGMSTMRGIVRAGRAMVRDSGDMVRDSVAWSETAGRAKVTWPTLCKSGREPTEHCVEGPGKASQVVLFVPPWWHNDATTYSVISPMRDSHLLF